MFVFCLNHRKIPKESFPQNFVKIRIDLAEILRISKLDWRDGEGGKEGRRREEGGDGGVKKNKRKTDREKDDRQNYLSGETAQAAIALLLLDSPWCWRLLGACLNLSTDKSISLISPVPLWYNEGLNPGCIKDLKNATQWIPP